MNAVGYVANALARFCSYTHYVTVYCAGLIIFMIQGHLPMKVLICTSVSQQHQEDDLPIVSVFSIRTSYVVIQQLHIRCLSVTGNSLFVGHMIPHTSALSRFN